jgi:hypothetical protein
MVRIDELPQKARPIDQLRQLINGAQQWLSWQGSNARDIKAPPLPQFYFCICILLSFDCTTTCRTWISHPPIPNITIMYYNIPYRQLVYAPRCSGSISTGRRSGYISCLRGRQPNSGSIQPIVGLSLSERLCPPANIKCWKPISSMTIKCKRMDEALDRVNHDLWLFL